MQNNKVFIGGVQGSGKTECAKYLIKAHGLRCLVYTPNQHDFTTEPDNFIIYNYTDFYKSFDKFLVQAQNLAIQGKLDFILIDEFDMLSKSGCAKSQTFVDFAANHRHRNIGCIVIARRPQDIDTYIMEMMYAVICYAIQGERVTMKLDGFKKGFGTAVEQLQYKDYIAIVSVLGQPVQKMLPLQVDNNYTPPPITEPDDMKVQDTIIKKDESEQKISD